MAALGAKPGVNGLVHESLPDQVRLSIQKNAAIAFTVPAGERPNTSVPEIGDISRYFWEVVLLIPLRQHNASFQDLREETLYGGYLDWCRHEGVNPIQRAAFSAHMQSKWKSLDPSQFPNSDYMLEYMKE